MHVTRSDGASHAFCAVVELSRTICVKKLYKFRKIKNVTVAESAPQTDT